MEEKNVELPLDKNTVNKESDSEIAATESVIPKEVDEALDAIPDKEQAKVVREMMTMQIGAISASSENTISKQIKSEHITQYLEDSRVAMQEEYRERHEDKIFKTFLLVIILIFIIVLIVLLKDKPDVMEKVIYAAGGLIAGCVGGFGYGYKKGKDE